ncbi:MAG TPA: hypothetical protein DCY76_01450 [Flavobacteriales bacterium]|nr:hypothetical protein [Flavobacteriales bacterium]|tara:strand:- start:120 stop:698 length:579 start_codon:yes stop_codon:yes gene_type:complete
MPKVNSAGLAFQHFCDIRPMKKVLWIVLALVAIVFGFLISQGLYRTVEVEQGEQGGFILVGVDHVGPYMEIGAAFAKVKTQFPDGELAGIYYDNPEFVPEDSLRSFAGVKVSATEGLEVIAAHPGFRLVEIEKGPALYTEWSGGSGVVSMILGTMKAYPALKEACEETGLCTENSIAFEEYSDAGTRYVMTY